VSRELLDRRIAVSVILVRKILFEIGVAEESVVSDPADTALFVIFLPVDLRSRNANASTISRSTLYVSS